MALPYSWSGIEVAGLKYMAGVEWRYVAGLE